MEKDRQGPAAFENYRKVRVESHQRTVASFVQMEFLSGLTESACNRFGSRRALDATESLLRK